MQKNLFLWNICGPHKRQWAETIIKEKAAKWATQGSGRTPSQRYIAKGLEIEGKSTWIFKGKTLDVVGPTHSDVPQGTGKCPTTVLDSNSFHTTEPQAIF